MTVAILKILLLIGAMLWVIGLSEMWGNSSQNDAGENYYPTARNIPQEDRSGGD